MRATAAPATPPPFTNPNPPSPPLCITETCNPFTVLPALMNEYRVPELNVQNGVLKALSFMFEYIGEVRCWEVFEEGGYICMYMYMCQKSPQTHTNPPPPIQPPPNPPQMGKDYIYSVVTLLEDALMDRDLVHRQTACTTVKHLALGCAGLGCVWNKGCGVGLLEGPNEDPAPSPEPTTP